MSTRRRYEHAGTLADYLGVYITRLSGRLEAALARMDAAALAQDAAAARKAARDVAACALRIRRAVLVQRHVKER